MKRCLFFFACVFCTSMAYAQTLRELTSGHRTSLRGLSVVDDNVAWVSGSAGWFAVTADHGKTWKWKQLEAYKALDFRDIEAFSDKAAIMVSAGSPAVILQTVDAGETWTEVYRNSSPDIFLDGMDFWDEQRGIIFGDPIKSRMQLLATADGGKTWIDISANLTETLAEGEAGFAASGTTIRTAGHGIAWIATGGKNSRLFTTRDYGKSWSSAPIPILHGEASQGPFSIAFVSAKIGVAVGGDYLKDTLVTGNYVRTRNGGKTWQHVKAPPSGYRSAVEYVTKRKLVATGTSGTDWSADGGLTWQFISKNPFNAARKANRGTWLLLAGSGGKVAELILP